jgi:hypothetical protein
MKAVYAIIEILKNTPAVVDKLGSNPMRLYPSTIREETYPAGVLRSMPARTAPSFDGSGNMRIQSVDITLMGPAVDDLAEIAAAIETALDGVKNQTIAGVDVKEIRFIEGGADDWNHQTQLKEYQTEFQIHFKK